jgi:phage terminase small subunit
MAKLNLKQKKFVAEYTKTGNATQAAIKAGYSKKSARMIGPENLQKPYIAAEIDKTVTRITEKAELKAADVLAEIRKLAFVNLSHAYNTDGSLMLPHEMPEDVQAALSSLESDEIFVGHGINKKKIGATKKIKLSDKVRSLEMLAKYFKLLTDVQEHKVTASIGPVSDDEVLAAYNKIKSDC